MARAPVRCADGDEISSFGHIRHCRKSARADALRSRYDIRAVFTAAPDATKPLPFFARHLGLHGIDPEIAHLCRYKNLTRERLREKGIPQPHCVRPPAMSKPSPRPGNRFSIALKATDNSGSRGFSRIDRKEDLTPAAFQRAATTETTGIVIVEELLLPRPGTIAEQSSRPLV